MEPTRYKDHFVKFPYKKEVREDEINNGGIDLIKEPHRINEINEIKNAPWIKDFLIDVNSISGLFMTFGCLYSIDENKFHFGYVEFSFRPSASDLIKNKVTVLDDDFYTYMGKINHPGDWQISPVDFARGSLHWESSSLEIDNQIYDKAVFYFRCSEAEPCMWIFHHMRNFLVDYYPSLYPDLL